MIRCHTPGVVSNGYPQVIHRYSQQMVYTHEHILLRFNGHFGTSTSFLDRWSVGLRFGLQNQAPIDSAAKLQDFVNNAQTAANTFHATVGTNSGSSTFMDSVSGAQIGVLGKYVPTTQVTVVSPIATTAGAGTPTQPWSAAHVISLRTAIPRGRGSNGRMYWPCQALTPTAGTGRLSPAATTARVTAAKAFLDTLNGLANTYYAGTRLLVASAVGGGLYAQVTAIRADDRLDSIERRENDQPSVWQNANLV